MNTQVQPEIPRVLERFLRETLRGAEPPWPDGVSNEARICFLDAIEWHGITPYFHEVATRHLPAEVRTELRDRSVLQVAIEHERVEALRGAAAALHSRGIAALTMKGSALAYQIYESPHLRPRADHDLLIAANQIDEVRTVFSELGYAEHSTGGSLITAQTSFHRQAQLVSHVFDVHWRTSNVHVVSSALDGQSLFAAASAHPVVPGLLVPSLPHSLLFSLLHRAAHHHDSDRLIWLADIDKLARLLGPERVLSVLDDARRRGSLSVCVRGLTLTADWFATPLPPLPPVPSDRLRWLVRRRSRRIEYFLRDLTALPSWKSRAQWLRELAFPSEKFMRAHYGTDDSDTMTALYLRRGLKSLQGLFRRMGR